MSNDIEFESPKTILVVEDAVPDQALVEKRIRTLWPDCDIMNVQSLKSTHTALKEKDFDMVLLDLNLTDTFGPNTVEEVRKIDGKVPIIVMTGMLTSITADESLKNGANNILSKYQIMDDDFFNILEQNAAQY